VILDKAKQLDRVASDVLSEKAQLPGIDASQVRRIWPILVTIGDLVESEPLWHWLRGNLPSGGFGDARVQALSLLDAEDVEILLASSCRAKRCMTSWPARRAANTKNSASHDG
jgi:hypothetical protein